MEQSVISVEIQNPEVVVPTEIKIGLQTYRVDFLLLLGQLLRSDSISLTQAVNTAAQQLGIETINANFIVAVSNTLRKWTSRPLSEFCSLRKNKYEMIIAKQQQVELIRQLKHSLWRDVAILNKVNELFPMLPKLTLDDVTKTSNYWTKRSPKECNKANVPDCALVVANKQQQPEVFTLTISGPTIQYTQSVSKQTAKDLLRLALSEE